MTMATELPSGTLEPEGRVIVIEPVMVGIVKPAGKLITKLLLRALSGRATAIAVPTKSVTFPVPAIETLQLVFEAPAMVTVTLPAVPRAKTAEMESDDALADVDKVPVTEVKVSPEKGVIEPVADSVICHVLEA